MDFVLDSSDEAEAASIEKMGIATLRTDILMSDDKSKVRLGHEVLAFADELRSAKAAR